MITNYLIINFLIASVPFTPVWGKSTAIVMGICCAIALMVSPAIKKPLVGAKLPMVPISLPTFIAAMCFGHILGAGAILGISYMGRF